MSNARNLANLLGTKTKVKDVDVDGTELILDADADTSITADTDDQIDFKIAGADFAKMSDQTLTLTSSTSSRPGVLLLDTNADANPPFLRFQKDSASPADNDEIGAIQFYADDDGGNVFIPAQIKVVSDDVSNGSENGSIKFETAVDGTTAERMRIDSSGNLLIGRTSVGATGNGHSIRGGDSAIFSRDASGETMQICRNDDAGDIVRFKKNDGVIGAVSTNSGGDLLIDAPADIILDADGGDFQFKDGGTHVLNIENSSGDIKITSITNDKDIIFRGVDNSSAIDALTLDMSDGGKAIFRNGITLSDGDLNVASGHGIAFGQTTTSASGASADTTTLREYEEGTWTPSFVGSTSESGQSYSHQDGTYVKIGRMVHAKFRIILSAEGTFSGTYLLITGLPFNAASSPQAVHVNNCYFVSLGVNVYSVGLQLKESDNKMYLWAVKGANTSRVYLANTELTSTTELAASVVYQTS